MVRKAISWEDKVAIWDYRAKNVSHDLIAQRVGLDERTVIKVDKELFSLSPELIWTLPPHVQVKRTDIPIKVSLLSIEFDPSSPEHMGYFHFADKHVMRFCRVAVRRSAGPVAQRCRGTLELLSSPESFKPFVKKFKLHWADTDYTMESDTAESVDIDTWRHLDVVFSEPMDLPGWEQKQGYIDLPIIPRPEIAGPGTAPTTNIPLDPQKPDASMSVYREGSEYKNKAIHFSESSRERTGLIADGCWIAIPLALSRPDLARQAYCSPGDYLVKVEVGCEGGIGDTKCFRIVSTNVWNDLEMKAELCLPATE